MPKIVDHAQRRTEIVHALWQVIYLNGIDGVSFRSVAEAAGISIGRVQHYFPSRSELILEGCRQIARGAEVAEGAEGTERESAGGTSESASGSAMGDLREFCLAFIPTGEAMRIGASVWYTYVARAVMDEQIGEIIRATDRATLDLGMRLVERAGGWRQEAAGDNAGTDDAGATGGEVGGADNAAALAWVMRMIALGKGLAQEVMLDERSAASAKAILEAELAELAAH
ncbi:TetR/AcrR family transcriptional regulator [Brevibacterium spongiae]|uniref:TetR/AcrR family transcriptional regulator n=1 Tax=Brevibacterium spongiae TaxID=2909672 RepID=A0ABY5STT0_9MICO|nr:TetR/AcrR family transcriptional regulator [Brevibacterium spongiae]UVI36511.1 TetR/AcrR family transcriptional regulator [Brevibacterium spongiae]